MDNQLHEATPVPCVTGKLDTTCQSGNISDAFILEPRDLVTFEQAWNWQKLWQESLLLEADLPQAIWLLQHQNCYTLGRGASEGNLCFEPNNPPFPLHRIDRGGEVTYHLPGQLVSYLVLDLRRYQTDLNWYLRKLEQVVLDVLQTLGLSGEQINGLTGIWLDGYKVASFGVGCRRWVTQHGFALNIDCDLKGFDEIVPCGLRGYSVGKLDSWLPGLKVHDVQPLIRKSLAKHFYLKWVEESFIPDSLSIETIN